jgi:hypothetical protein
VLLLVVPLLAAGSSGNPLFDQLIDKGVAIPGGPVVKLPAPLIQPGSTPKDPETVLDKAAGRAPLKNFINPSIDAPISVEIEVIEAKGGERCAQVVHLRFVAYGKLKALSETDFIKQLLGGKGKKGSAGGAEPVVLDEKELNARGIKPSAAADIKEEYTTMTLTLLDKVQVEGVTRGVRTTAPYTILHAVQLDDRFRDDKKYPNQWRKIDEKGDGEKAGPPSPYTAMAGYVQATELSDPKGALLIEMHFVFHEPPGWFGEHNLLRSKLPIAIRDNVKNFRLKLRKE